MTAALVIAKDMLRAFAAQRLVLVLVLAAATLTFAMAHLSTWQRDGVEAALAEQQVEREASRPAGAGGGEAEGDAKKAREEEAALEQMFSFQQAMFLGAASFGGSVVALLLCSTALASPLRRGETRVVLSRPVSRTSYLLGRYLAVLVALAGYWGIMGLAFVAFFRSSGAPWPGWMTYAPLLLFCKAVMVGSVALGLSTFVRPVFAAAIAFLASSDWTQSGGALYLLLPGDDRLNLWWQLMQGNALSARDMLLGAGYAVVVSAVGVAIALLRFRRLDI